MTLQVGNIFTLAGVSPANISATVGIRQKAPQVRSYGTIHLAVIIGDSVSATVGIRQKAPQARPGTVVISPSGSVSSSMLQFWG